MSEYLFVEFRMKLFYGLVLLKDFNIISFRFDVGELKVSFGWVVVYLNDLVIIIM